MLTIRNHSKILLGAGFGLAVPIVGHASVLWTTDFSGTDETARALLNLNVDPLLSDVLTGSAANLTFSDTSFTGSLFQNVLSRGAFSPNTNVDNPAAASPQNGGSWQSEFRYSGGTQTISLESVLFNVVRTNSTGATQATDAVVRDVLLTAEYSLDSGGSWLSLDLAKTVDMTASSTSSPNLGELYTFASPLTVNHATQDLWIRFRAENANGSAGAYVDINDIAFNGLVVVPEPGAALALLGGATLLLGLRCRRVEMRSKLSRCSWRRGEENRD